MKINGETEEINIESLSISIKSQILKDFFQRLIQILEIHSTGYLLIFFDKVDELYITMKNEFDLLLQSEDFESLNKKYSDFLPNSLHSAGEDVDIEWEFLYREILVFKGELLQFCIQCNASYSSKEIEEFFNKIFNNIDSIIEGYRQKKNKMEEEWLKKIENGNPNLAQNQNNFIDKENIENLKNIKSNNFDFTKLIRLCEEININYSNKCFYTVGILSRAIIDHIPPLFGFNNFHEFVNNYQDGGKSLKTSMKNLESFQRNLADSYLHSQIREKEILPTRTQIDCSNALDALISEICRIFK